MDHNSNTFRQLLERMTAAIVRGEGAAAAACFTPEGVYHDAFYGEFAGRTAIASMVEEHFHGNARDFAWTLYDVVADDELGYASYDFSYTATLAGSEGRRVAFSGMSRCRLSGGLIVRYDEVFERSLALVQLDFAEARIVKLLRRWAATEKI